MTDGRKVEARADAPADGAQAIRRALQVARTVAQLQKTGATLSRVTRATGLHRATVFRILRSLTDERMLRFQEQDRSYRIGPLAFELGLASGDADIQAKWLPVLREIASRTGLTSYLMARSNDEAVCLLCVQGTMALRAIPIEVGQRVPLGIGAGGSVILAALDEDEIRRIASANQDRMGLFPSGALTAEMILENASETRGRGFSISSGTVAQGVSGVGVLVPGMPPHIQFAVTVSAVTNAIGLKEASRLALIMAATLEGRDTSQL